jgi:steroid delta-isomerase-like uncharacterized protein
VITQNGADTTSGPGERGRGRAGREIGRNGGNMTIEDNKALVRRFIDEVFVGGSFAAVDEILADDFEPHTWPFSGDGKADLKAAIERVGKGLTDPAWTIEDMIAEDDRVAVRVTAFARQTGPFMGLPPTDRSYSIGEIHIFRIRDGRIVEHWHQFDGLGMMRQLGIGATA